VAVQTERLGPLVQYKPAGLVSLEQALSNRSVQSLVSSVSSSIPTAAFELVMP